MPPGRGAEPGRGTRVLNDVLRKVVVGVAADTPELSPWKFALDLAAGSGASVRAVMVDNSVDAAALTFAGGDAALELRDRARRMWSGALKPLLQRVADDAAERGVELTVENREGGVVDELLELSEDASLLVFGRGRRSRAGDGVLGDHAELLARRCHRPLLVAPVAYLRPQRVVAAFAGKELGGRVLALAGCLARALGTGMIVLSVAEERARLRELHGRARELLDGQELEGDYVGLPGRPEEAIPSRCSERDLLVLGPHGHSSVYRMLFGSVTDRVLRAVPGPVALPEREA